MMSPLELGLDFHGSYCPSESRTAIRIKGERGGEGIQNLINSLTSLHRRRILTRNSINTLLRLLAIQNQLHPRIRHILLCLEDPDILARRGIPRVRVPEDKNRVAQGVVGDVVRHLLQVCAAGFYVFVFGAAYRISIAIAILISEETYPASACKL